MTNGKVTIVADDNGNVIRVSKNNPEYGHVRLVQEKTFIGAGNWAKRQTRSTLLHGTVEDLQATGLAEAKELPGHIVSREHLEPFQEKDGDRDLKVAGDTGVICCSYGQPIYRKAFYSMDLSEPDVLIQHTNQDAIREANGLEPRGTQISKEHMEEITANIQEEEEPKSTRRNKAKENEQVDLEDSIEEVENSEEIEVEEDDSFEL